MRSIVTGFLFLQFFCACSGTDRSDTTQSSENEVDAARNFIRLALDGKWEDARKMVVDDSLNNAYMDLAQRNYQQRLDVGARTAYRKASIIVSSVEEKSEKESVIHYSNSYKKKEDSVKVVLQDGKWLIDLKYSFPATAPAQ
ncbi:hypothetical protein SAMN05444008_11518 [Cnuella takakiae]|uniref:DUF4878 domain-containing protein n=1 Tax=Cnuella takakiae TaxID=1302690 RepID=A0A1M5FYB7_9BACT|nr:hypothetical protein [Cnuella takakiae]OLY92257.1 hypothetical protein BUE76_10400 [Cnuella takakiae]SHF96476.1 hypothetical protein SAMN05444008_11518 [Cnuella takakiae]